MTRQAKRIYLHNKHLIRVGVKYRDQATGGLANFAGGPVWAWLSLTEDGAEIHADLKVLLSEVADGVYSNTIPAAAIDQHLAALENETVYQVIRGANDEVQASTSFIVTRGRQVV